MTVRLAINPITWTNDDLPELGGETPLDVCLAETKATGYAGTEMGGKFPKTAAELRPLLDRHGLDFVSGWYSAKLLQRDAEAEIEAMAAHLELMAGMGCKVMVFAEGSGSAQGDRSTPLSRRPRMSEAEWAVFTSRLMRVAEHMLARGVQLAFHHHMGTVIETEAEIDRLMRETGPAVGLLLDTGHATFAGGDPLALARRHVRRIVHVHCKDVRGPVLERVKREDWSFLDAIVEGVFTVPGDGSIAFAPVLGELARGGYHGWLVVEAEQDPAKAPPLEFARMGFANLSRLARDAGFEVDRS